MSYQDLISDKIIKCPSLYKINIDHTRDNFDLSSEEDGSKSPTKNFEKIFNQNFETYYNTLMIDNKIIKKKAMYNDYEITSFNFFIMIKIIKKIIRILKNEEGREKEKKQMITIKKYIINFRMTI